MAISALVVVIQIVVDVHHLALVGAMGVGITVLDVLGVVIHAPVHVHQGALAAVGLGVLLNV